MLNAFKFYFETLFFEIEEINKSFFDVLLHITIHFGSFFGTVQNQLSGIKIEEEQEYS